MTPPTSTRLAGWLVLISLGLLLLGVGVGSEGWQWPGDGLWDGLWNPDLASVEARIVWEVRVPRTLGAWAAGALLGLAGAVAQGLFRNPLADPYLLGSASGAALGVALLLMLTGLSATLWPGLELDLHAASLWARLGLTGAAFAGAVAAVLLTLVLARGAHHTLRLLLAGVVVGVVLGAMGSLVLYAVPSALQSMQSFMLGSTAYVGWSSVWLMLAVGSVCLCGALICARALDALALGEDTALSLGLPLSTLRACLIAAMALATGTAVAQAGLIAFVGLAAPHLVRASGQGSHRHALPLASLMGGALLCAADLAARGVLAPQELPVGALTAVLGGGYMLWRMQRAASTGGGA